ncbi:hypothetical protein SAMN04489724_0508 [Algoriphagus locisalis]|uniref:Uncharacterized protein n=1 Tax=Algoriphagus locisalis TaxID=305507 RepID=A0A1I6XIP9_9BACT|nr:hypothetical protein SAMN04489724_0508 [Algoriphagus locisalis]
MNEYVMILLKSKIYGEIFIPFFIERLMILSLGFQ